MTTLTCVVDSNAWPLYTAKQRSDINLLYVPYLVLGTFLRELFSFFLWPQGCRFIRSSQLCARD